MPKFTKNRNIITAVEYKFRRNSTAVKCKFIIINGKKSDFLLKRNIINRKNRIFYKKSDVYT